LDLLFTEKGPLFLQNSCIFFQPKSTSAMLFSPGNFDVFQGTEATVNSVGCTMHPCISRGEHPVSTATLGSNSEGTPWETLTNEHLREHQIEARIDRRSLEAQGIEREPQSHLGPSVSSMERRGMLTDVGQRLEAERAALTACLEAAAKTKKDQHCTVVVLAP